MNLYRFTNLKKLLRNPNKTLPSSSSPKISNPVALAMSSSLLSNRSPSSTSYASSSQLHPFKTHTALTRPFSCRGSPYLHFKTLSIPSYRLASGSRSWSSSAVSFVAMTTDMSAKVIDGKSVANQIREEVAGEVARLKDEYGIVPGLAVILVGSRKDSQTYVRNKKKACEVAGINSYKANLPEDCTEEEVLEHITRFNNDPSVHGILVQLPLPPLMDVKKIQNAVRVEKDVDGFHLLNIGQLASQGDPLFVPCTPKGCMELLHRYGVEIKGKRAVVIGRSTIVGTPAAFLLQGENATVTTVHSRTTNSEEVVKQADIIISACGVANLVRGSWIKPGAVVIDVGINPIDDAESPRGYRLVGDVCYEEASKVASAITPVPGGVGPMTIAMLLSNTLTAAKRIHNIK